MASNKYFYQILGVQSNASQDEIKQAFHQLAHKYHPDISTEPNAAQKFQDINEAYTALRNQKPVNKKRSKLPIIAATGITSLVAIIIFFYQNSLNSQEIQAGILNHNSEAIQSLENANINFAKKVISGTDVKVSLIDFYLKNPPLWKKLDSYHDSIRAEILKDDEVYRRLRDYYYHQIDNEVKEDKFKKALPLLGEIKKAYPKKSELFHKYQEIQEKKQQRLADITQKYMDCLYKTWVPLLERTHCMAAARDTIETVGIEHELPTDANLPAMYAKEVRLALKDQNYDHADDILLDWEKLLPANSGQRDVLKDILYLRRERENIVADLSGNDKMQIAKRLHQLSADPVLQQQILEIPKVKNNISKYKFDEVLTIIASNYGDISPSYESKLREILEIPEEVDEPDKTTEVASDYSSTPIIPIAASIISATEVVTNNNKAENKTLLTDNNKTDTLLTECQQLYNKNYLTRGKNTALSCYRKVLKIEPNNNQALDGLNNIENKYYLWADSNLKRKKFGRVKSYIQALQKFNSNSSRLTGLKEKLNAAQRQTVAQATQATKAKEAARLARLKASKEKEVKERKARLKADKERAAKRRAARYKAAKAKVAKEKAAKRKVANAKAAQERAAKRKLARQKAAKERVAKKRKAANAKAAQQRAAKRKLARAKVAKERAAKRKAARAKVAQERRARRKTARAKAAKERAAKRKLARQKAAKERAAKRKAARAKAANERAARRKLARQKAAKEKVAKRKAARTKAAQERAAKRRADRRAKVAKERRAKRKTAREKAIKAARIKAVRKAARRKIAKEKAARAKAANERSAKRKAARRAKAVQERRAKRNAARKKAAAEIRAKRKAARRAKAAQERKARRNAARKKAAAERRAKRKAERRAKAVQERKAKRNAARKKAAAERRAKRKAERRAKAVQERRAKRNAARKKAAAERRAKRKAARRAKAAKESAARRKAARAKAIKERAAKRKAARRLAAKKKAAKRKIKRKRGASCSRLVRQMSTGIKPLTAGQRRYFRRRCR